ncbi:flavodoxin family protein [Clostridium arbusti]|uniref:flavodoxin family protein n=1 Tax=Clostridium arbusti TaxID=1137848 RepID=UPI0002897EA7|nr:flavodoxin family protein [Clostridium arbusti]
MKTLIIYTSVHHGNTEKIASVIAETMNADKIKPSEVNENILDDYDLIGFASGIYYSKLHKSIIELVDNLPKVYNKKAFVFSTSGQGKIKLNKSIEEKLEDKGFNVVGSFNCKGYDTFGPFKLVGGLAKGRPNAGDFANAKSFAEDLLNHK